MFPSLSMVSYQLTFEHVCKFISSVGGYTFQFKPPFLSIFFIHFCRGDLGLILLCVPFWKGSTGKRASLCANCALAWMPFQRCAGRGCASSVSRDSSEKRVWPLDKSLGFCALVLTRGRLAAPPEDLMNFGSLSRTALCKAVCGNSLCGPRF